MIGKAATSLVVVLSVAVCSAGEQNVNLVPNPGFEELDQGKPRHWRFDRTKTDAWGMSEEARGGKRSAWGQLKKSLSASWWTHDLAVESDTTYDVEVWVKIDRPAVVGAARLGVYFNTHSTPHRSVLLTPGKWCSVTDTVRSWPDSAAARIRLFIYKCLGKVSFDDVSFRKSKVDWMSRFPHTDLSTLAFEPSHPCVLLNAAEIEEQRRAIRTEPWARRAYGVYLPAAKQFAAESPFRLPELDFSKVGPGSNYMKKEAGNAKILGMVYQLSQERKYADAARERLIAYAEQFPKGNLCRGRYGYTTGYALHDTTIAYDFVRDSGVLSPEEHRAIESMLREGFRGMRRHGDVMGINNRGAVCLGAMAAIAFCLQDRELIEWTISGPYGFDYHLHNGVGDDGLWIEGISYGYMALGGGWYSGYMSVVEAAHHAGIDLYSHPRFKRLLNAPLEYAFPDFSLPANGHCSYSASLLGQAEARRYILPWARLRDPRCAWAVSEGLKIENWLPLGYLGDVFCLVGNAKADFTGGAPPELKTTLFPKIGHAMLRAGRDDDEICVLLDYGPFGSHGNPDKLSITLYAHDHVLCPDGIVSYWWPTTFMYECQTIGHNTVIVDEKTQFATAESTLNAWLPAPGMKIVDGEDRQGNPGVKMRRSLALTDSYLLDVFAVTSDETHRYDWAYRNFGELVVSPQLTPRAGTLGVTDGYQYITGVERGPAAGAWTAEWDLNEMNLVWNSSFELQNGKVWQVTGWRIPTSGWRPFVAVDTEVLRSGKQSLRIELPEGNQDAVHLLATYKCNRFRAGKQYLLEGYVQTRDVPAGDVGLWVGDQLVCKAPPAGEDNGWIKIGGAYRARTTNRDLVKIGVRNVERGTVWFDDISLRVREEGANALRLTMLDCPGTEVIASEGEGLRPFQQAILIARRHAQSTVFASVMEPYYGEPGVQALRPLTSPATRDHTGVEVLTRRTIDRFLVSYSSGQKACDGLAADAIIASVSLDRSTDSLRRLCLARGTQVAAGPWRLAAADPATLSLEHHARAYVLRCWGEDGGRVTVTAPDVTTGFSAWELSSDDRPAKAVEAIVEGHSIRLDTQAGKSYLLAGRSGK